MELRLTNNFRDWLRKLNDPVGKRAIHARLTRLAAAGLFGDSKRFGKISEMRINVGPGYRLYYTIRGAEIVFILAGGDKSTQQNDIKVASKILEQLEE